MKQQDGVDDEDLKNIGRDVLPTERNIRNVRLWEEPGFGRDRRYTR